MTHLRVLPLAGTPYEIGYIHGKAYAADIQLLTEERMRLATDPFWTGGRGATLAEVVALGKASLAAHEEYAPTLMEEMRGMADATGLDLAELVTMNGFTDFVDAVAALPVAGASVRQNVGTSVKTVEAPTYRDDDSPDVLTHRRTDALTHLDTDSEDTGGCTAFLVAPGATSDGTPWIGQTWDMHASATPHVILLDISPANAPALLTFTITGCVGMIGINEHGVAVGINNLNGSDGRPGVHWVYVVRQMLAQRTFDAALRELQRAPLSGAHNYLLMAYDEAGTLRGANIEAGSTRKVVTPLQELLVHTNHCVAPEMNGFERARKGSSLESTTTRLAQAQRILADERGAITLESLQELTRYQEPGAFSICAYTRPGYDVETSGAAIMSPATRELWAAWGQPTANPYERFAVRASERVPA